MPKRYIALSLALILTMAPVSGVFGSIMDKINSYSIIQNFSRALWFESSDENVAQYAIKVADSSVALNSYGDLVGSPPEYYFTDMVFIQQKYEEALVDLYYFRAESAWTQFDNNKRPAVDEAIAGTYWVAQQNGVTYTEEQIQAKFLEQLDEQLIPITEGFIDDMEDRFSDIERYTDILSDKIRAYYLEPNINTFKDLIRSAYSFEEAAGTFYLDISSIISRTLELLSSGLASSLINHARENEDRLSMAPRSVSPVEVSKAERELVFRG